MKKIAIITLLSSLLFMNTGCDNYLDVNKNTDAPDRVDAYLYLAGVIQQYQGFYWDVRATGPLAQMMGTTGYTSFATHYYSQGSDACGEIWRVTYWLQGKNLENMISQAIDGEQWRLAGIGMAIKAYSWDQLTKEHGDLPLDDAFVPGLLSHHYNSQEEVYTAVREWAYKAIEYLQMPDATNMTNVVANDFIYQGDADKWTKFAYGVIVRNLASLTNKRDFAEKYAAELIECASKSFQSADDDATVSIPGGGGDAVESAYNNFWGVTRGNISRAYFQHEWAVQVMTGTVPVYNQSTGLKNPNTDLTDNYRPYEIAKPQIITDTVVTIAGHYDPRMAVKLGTTSDADYADIDIEDSVKAYKYYGGSFTGTSGPIGSAPSYYGRNANASVANDGSGRWIYRDDAPYILMTTAELKFDLAEAYWKLGRKGEALQAFRDGIEADLAFTSKYLYPGKEGNKGGDKISKKVFEKLAAEYLAGPYVQGLSEADFTLSHIMMQKFVALYPWGAQEAWVDQRKYHYDIQYTGDYPTNGNGWTQTQLEQKWDTDPNKVYKGYFLSPAQVQSRKGTYNVRNAGSPCYRIRPRYNSEYMWNIPSLEGLRPIPGTAENYQCSIPWFAYPGDMPESL